MNVAYSLLSLLVIMIKIMRVVRNHGKGTARGQGKSKKFKIKINQDQNKNQNNDVIDINSLTANVTSI